MDSKIVLTLESFVAVLDERVKQMNDANSKEHAVILKKIEDLCKHVNEENQKMDGRIETLEDCENEEKVTWKVLGKIGAAIVSVSGIVFALAKFIMGI